MSEEEKLELLMDPLGLAREEYDLLKHLAEQGDFYYLARDMSETLFAYIDKPVKDEGAGVWWDTFGGAKRIKSNLFLFIEFGAREAYNIQTMMYGSIKSKEVVVND